MTPDEIEGICKQIMNSLAQAKEHQSRGEIDNMRQQGDKAMVVKRAMKVEDTPGSNRESGQGRRLHQKTRRSHPRKVLKPMILTIRESSNNFAALTTLVDCYRMSPAPPDSPVSEGNKERTGTEESKMTTGQEKYEEPLRLAREADKKGGPLPVGLLREAAETGYPPALYALANWHLHGKGVKKDYKKAVSLLTKAAKERFAPAEYDLAVSYECGKGVDKSEEKACRYYLQAAEDGNLQAQTEVARCFYYGIGTKKDFAKAVEWYGKAATRGNSDAQCALGVAYEHGEGVEKNIQTAIDWYKKAAEKGDEVAAQALAELEDSIRCTR